MKIGILTFHREINDGSILQTYCLYKLLEEKFPKNDISVIDYLPRYIRRKEKLVTLTKSMPFFKVDFGKLSRKRKLDLFYKQKVKFSKFSSLSDSLSEAKEYLKELKYEVIIVGSDTVWDTRPNAGAPQAPNIYFLPNVEGVKKIAFAASMDKGGPAFVAQETWKKLVGYINDFDFISVRDSATRKYLISSGIQENRIDFLPDPTLLYDFSKIVEIPHRFINRFKKLAAVALSDRKLQYETTQQLKKLDYNVINLLLTPTKGQIELPSDMTFEQKLGLHSKFDFMITDRFHGCILALKQNPSIPVVMVEPDYFYEQRNSKGRDLFERLGLEAMVWRYNSNEPIPKDLIESHIKVRRNLAVNVSEKFKNLKEEGLVSIERMKLILEKR